MGARLADILSCVETLLASSRGELARSLRFISSAHGPEPWRCLEWQHAKYIFAKALAECMCRIAGCHAYLLEMHGGEPSGGVGDKDADIAFECPEPLPPGLEEEAERLAERVFSEAAGVDVKKALGIPNIVEVHSASEFLISRHIGARNARYVIKLC